MKTREEEFQAILNRAKEEKRKILESNNTEQKLRRERLDTELEHLINVKVEKMIASVLAERFTQLSHLSEEEQEFHRNLARAEILEKIVLPILRKM